MQTLALKSIENDTHPPQPDTVAGTSEPDVVKLAGLIRAHSPHDGCFELRIPGVYAIRRSRMNTELVHATQRPVLCIVAQGAKSVMLGQEVYQYDPSRMLIFSVDLPVAAQVTGGLKTVANRQFIILSQEGRAAHARKEIEMRPYVICHMLSSVDGKIDSAALQAVTGKGEYEATGAKLQGDAWICGRTTMQQHFAEDGPFVSASNTPAGPQPVYVARRADSYAISIDTLGKLRWSGSDFDGDHLICVVSERVPEDYLPMLRERGISYIVSGASSLDLVQAVNLLGQYFGIRTLLLEGGGHINGAFLQADLIDEVSLLVVPGIDGRHDIPAVFDGVSPAKTAAVPLKLKSVEQRENDALWIRYEVVRS